MKYLNEVVQGEPLEAVDSEIRGQLASIGIRKGTPFAPDARMKKILTDAVHVGAATARAMFFFCCTGITPAMALKMVGVGSQYAVTSHDVRKKDLDGGKTYRMHLPAGIPARNFWSLTVYDPQTRSYLQTDQPFPSIGSQRAGLVVNPDTSVDIWFGPKPPPGKEANWVQT